MALADRPRGQSRKNSESTTSLVGLGRSFEGDALSSGASPVEHAVELQFEDDHLTPYAHYGYVVRLLGQLQETQADDRACSTASYSRRATIATFSSPAVSLLPLGSLWSRN